MKYLSLFSGIGGFELGIQQAYEKLLDDKKTGRCGQKENIFKQGVFDFSGEPDIGQYPSCIGYSEIDKYAIKIYETHFPTHKNFGDITKINADELPDFDFLCGGFPCQAFSIAGKRKGFDDTRGTLFFEIARILRAKQPRLFLLENVKGLLSHDHGRTFSTIIATLDELGYDLQWQVLNSKNHGVPQNRERIFIVGHLRGTPRPQVFPLRENGGEHNEMEQKQAEVTGTINSSMSKGGNKQDAKASVLIQLNNPTHSNDRVYGDKGLSPSLNTMQGGNRQPKVAIPVLTPDRIEKRQNGRRFKENGEPSFTLTSQDKHGVSDGMKIRRLTPIECARLQGFPNDWHKIPGISDSQAYKCYGNAVTVNVIRDIMKKIFL